VNCLRAYKPAPTAGSGNTHLTAKFISLMCFAFADAFHFRGMNGGCPVFS